jgi:hypothetical protein
VADNERVERPEPRRLTAIGWHSPLGAGESGGSQPHRFLTDEGLYLVKARNNPQGERVLVNELVGSLCLDWLGVLHPAAAVIQIPPEVIEDSPAARFQDGTPLESGLAFGSEYWQSDEWTVVPASTIRNLADVAGTLVFDSWVRPHDSRQGRVRPSADEPGMYDYFPVDQGFCIGSPSWSSESLAGDRDISTVTPVLPVKVDEVLPFVHRLRLYSQPDAEHIVAQVPEEWLSEEERTGLVAYLEERASLAADTVAAGFGTSEEVA